MKKFIIILLVTLGITIIPTLFIDFNTSYLIKPPLFPPKLLFPIVWTILYILMSISLYLSTKKDNDLYLIYIIQLVVNSLWSLIFFKFKMYLLALIWIVLLLVLVVIMLKKMLDKNKLAFYLQIPYVIWILFATYLTLSIYLLN